MNFHQTGLANFNTESYWLSRLTKALIILNHRGGAFYLISSLSADEVLVRVLFKITSAQSNNRDLRETKELLASLMRRRTDMNRDGV
jgi:hypothetical protein